MFTHIKTSKENRIRVAELTRKLNLGTENIIARIAFTYSISQNRKFNILDIKDAGGKEYTKNVLFGGYYPYYRAMLCTHYNLYKTDKDLSKYFKIHIDDGIELIAHELADNPNLNGFDFLIDKIDDGLQKIK